MWKTLLIVLAFVGTVYASYSISLDTIEQCRYDWKQWIICRGNKGIYDIQQQIVTILANQRLLETKIDEIMGMVDALIKISNK